MMTLELARIHINYLQETADRANGRATAPHRFARMSSFVTRISR